jgi:dTDP-4-dehydrorhamnose 3,5-epimerase-like enzyme
MSVAASELPAGTLLRPLEAHEDERSAFMELFRAE